ncbi:MAG: gamma-glutamyl carboxylase [Myxococcaceae bacterium]|nr:gamma-glutamyl carboxylase [Myxococcaceae bacterium]
MIERLLRPVDIAWLVAFRVLFGITVFVSMCRFLAYGWVDDFFVKPSFHFKYWGFAWVEPLSATGMHALFAVLAVLGLAIAAGACFRLASFAFIVGFAYVQLIDVATYLNHYYLAALLGLLLALSPAGKAWSLDAWLHKRSRTHLPAAWHWLFRFQVGVVYTFAGLAKANTDWLVHAQPLRIWLASRTGLPLLGPLFQNPLAAPAMSWMGFLFDTTIAWFLLARRTRPYAFAIVIVFHTMTRALFPIGMFPVIMILSALVFFDSSWPHTLDKKLRPLLPLPAPPVSDPVTVTVTVAVADPDRARATRRGRLALTLAATYCLFQVVLPLRFLAYGGDVRWHEQGMRFSWRVMVREKNGSVTFLVRSKTTGREWQVSPRSLLTKVQEREMSTQPDLVLQLAHRVAADCERRGLGPVEVRVDAEVSLNGRKIAPLVDPTVDLAAEHDGVLPARWILPHPADAPPHLRPI